MLYLLTMTPTTDIPRSVHHGRNVKRIREILGVKQEALAAALGEDWSQRRISTLEAREVIEPELIEQLAKALKVPSESIKTFSDETAINFFNTFNDNSVNQGANYQPVYNINPVDKWLEAVAENKRLYDALLKSEQDKVAMLEKTIAILEKMLSEKK